MVSRPSGTTTDEALMRERYLRRMSFDIVIEERAGSPGSQQFESMITGRSCTNTSHKIFIWFLGAYGLNVRKIGRMRGDRNAVVG
jgi:hypothetical protein